MDSAVLQGRSLRSSDSKDLFFLQEGEQGAGVVARQVKDMELFDYLPGDDEENFAPSRKRINFDAYADEADGHLRNSDSTERSTGKLWDDNSSDGDSDSSSKKCLSPLGYLDAEDLSSLPAYDSSAMLRPSAALL